MTRMAETDGPEHAYDEEGNYIGPDYTEEETAAAAEGAQGEAAAVEGEAAPEGLVEAAVAADATPDAVVAEATTPEPGGEASV